MARWRLILNLKTGNAAVGRTEHEADVDNDEREGVEQIEFFPPNSGPYLQVNTNVSYAFAVHTAFAYREKWLHDIPVAA